MYIIMYIYSRCQDSCIFLAKAKPGGQPPGFVALWHLKNTPVATATGVKFCHLLFLLIKPFHLVFKLTVVQVCVEAACGHKFIVVAGFYDVTVVDYQDNIRISYG